MPEPNQIKTFIVFDQKTLLLLLLFVVILEGTEKVCVVLESNDKQYIVAYKLEDLLKKIN